MNERAYEEILAISSRWYNEGLVQAQARDLTGAVRSLKKSLEYNKRNTQARNLLGLVYYEQGNVVEALKEWVISKNLDAGEYNNADYFLERIQDDPMELDNINNAVRKYNLALEKIRDGNYDIAVIQLKKAIALNPRYVKAMKLLALLYYHDEDYRKAKITLLEAKSIDHTDIDVLRYLTEVDLYYKPQQQQGTAALTPQEASITDFDEEMGMITKKKGLLAQVFNPQNPNFKLFINLVVGVVIGVLVVYYLIVPSTEARIRDEYNSKKVDYSTELSAKSAAIAQQEKEITDLRKQVSALQSELNGISYDTIEIAVGDETFSAFFDAWNNYNDLKSREYTDEELVALAMELWNLDLKGIKSKYAQSLLSKMREDIYPLSAKLVYKAGKDLLDEGNLESAVSALRAATDFDPTSDSAMYYLGKALQEMGEYNEAIYYYRQMLTVCPSSALRDYIPQRLEECEEAAELQAQAAQEDGEEGETDTSSDSDTDNNIE